MDDVMLNSPNVQCQIHISMTNVYSSLSICKHIPFMSGINFGPYVRQLQIREPYQVLLSKAEKSYQKYGSALTT